jgi:hypothetical protein
MSTFVEEGLSQDQAMALDIAIRRELGVKPGESLCDAATRILRDGAPTLRLLHASRTLLSHKRKGWAAAIVVGRILRVMP